jgi:hypothetical protein
VSQSAFDLRQRQRDVSARDRDVSRQERHRSEKMPKKGQRWPNDLPPRQTHPAARKSTVFSSKGLFRLHRAGESRCCSNSADFKMRSSGIILPIRRLML